jgi:hypothetical protein
MSSAVRRLGGGDLPEVRENVADAERPADLALHTALLMRSFLAGDAEERVEPYSLNSQIVPNIRLEGLGQVFFTAATSPAGG